MAKILSKSGDSLADVYDVEGSIAGIDDLKSEDVNLVHEMGSTVFAERLSGTIVALGSGILAQSLAFNTALVIPEFSRILGVQVMSDDASRVADFSVHVTSTFGAVSRDSPLFIWENADGSTICRVQIGGTLATLDALKPPLPAQVPNLIIGDDSPQAVNTLSVRGATNGFGAGTVSTQALIYLAFPQIGGLSNRGLPLPGW